MPETRPSTSFSKNGVCTGCVNFFKRKEVNWNKAKENFLKIIEKYMSKDGSSWDCIVPVSGGKDSTYQVLKVLELGLNPLCVTATTCELSEIGKRNIENLKKLGVDYLEFTTNKSLRYKINKLALEEVGDISWPEHVSIFTIPYRVSVSYSIPLIIWGENPQNEYGSPNEESTLANIHNRQWLEEFGGLLGLRVTDLIGRKGIKKRDLIPYTFPSEEELKKTGTVGLFLGQYIPWDGYSNVLLSQAHGLEVYHKAVETTFTNYENLDNLQAGIHDYFKFIKYGFGRATDMACTHLRRGRITREEACDIVRERDGIFPSSYLGVELKEILEPLEMSVDEFINICDRFTNKKLFKTDARGNLTKKQDQLIKLYHPDNPSK